jgi:S1-C subfamily serine protease
VRQRVFRVAPRREFGFVDYQVVADDQPWLGVSVISLEGITEGDEQLWVADVTPGSPAARAGLRPRDLLLGLRTMVGAAPPPGHGFRHQLAEFYAGASAHVLFERQGAPGDVVVKLKSVVGARRVSHESPDLGWTIEDRKGATVSELTHGKTPEKGGVQVGDVVLAVNGATTPMVLDVELALLANSERTISVRLRDQRGHTRDAVIERGTDFNVVEAL